MQLGVSEPVAANHGGTSHWGEASATPAVWGSASESIDEEESYWPISSYI